MKTLLVALHFTIILITLRGDNVCEESDLPFYDRYHIARHCQRSNKSVMALANFESVRKCENFARDKNALAFNYAPQERGTKNLYERANKNATKYRGNKYPSGKDIIEQSEEYYNCQVLACPELKNFSSMINDTRFDYYSLYANPPPPDNATCLPGMGMFIYYDKPENYSRAFNACQEINGSLAGVVTESQTNALSKLLKLKYNTTHQDMAFVDLREKEHNETTNQYTYHTSEGFPLECFAFRAWSPGFPRKFKHAACVTITKENSWKVVPCTKKKPFICEIFPTGPDRRISSTRKCSIKRPNNPSDKQNAERF